MLLTRGSRSGLCWDKPASMLWCRHQMELCQLPSLLSHDPQNSQFFKAVDFRCPWGPWRPWRPCSCLITTGLYPRTKKLVGPSEILHAYFHWCSLISTLKRPFMGQNLWGMMGMSHGHVWLGKNGRWNQQTMPWSLRRRHFRQRLCLWVVQSFHRQAGLFLQFFFRGNGINGPLPTPAFWRHWRCGRCEDEVRTTVATRTLISR